MTYNEMCILALQYARAYAIGSPIVTDAEYDNLVHRIKEIEEGMLPSAIHPKSPSKWVEPAYGGGLSKIVNRFPAYSLQDYFN